MLFEVQVTKLLKDDTLQSIFCENICTNLKDTVGQSDTLQNTFSTYVITGDIYLLH